MSTHDTHESVTLVGYVKCPVCDKLFADPNAQRQFCSYHCRRHARYRAAQHEATCVKCGAVYIRHDPRRRYCSFTCRRQAEAERVRTGTLRPKAPPLPDEERRDLTPKEIRKIIEEETARKRRARALGQSAFELDPWNGYQSSLTEAKG